MWEAVVFGVLACSSLVVGGVVGSYWEAPERVTGVILAFASGTMLLWLATAVLLVPAVPIGRVLLSGADPGTLAFPLSFAGGAVLAALADTLMPEAFERGRPFNAFATCAGFFVAFVLADM